MMKNLRFMLVTAFMLVCGVMSATEVTWQASGTSTLPTAIGEDITLAWTNASFSSSKPTAAYLSANGTLTVTAPEGMAVQSVTFKFSGENLSLTADPQGNYATDSWNNTGTWSGSANAVTFTAPGKRYITKITVTYIAESSVPTTPVLSITQITNFDDTYDLDNDTKTLVVYYKNEGTDAQNAKLTLFVNNVENNVVNLNTIANGANTWVNLPYNKETIAAGAQTVKVSLTADGVDAIEESKTVTFTKAAPEATFSVAAANVNVAHDATSYQVVATVTNTSNVDATGVQVLLQKSLQNVAEPQAIDLAALASKDVTFTVQAPDGGFTAGATTMFVMVKAYEFKNYSAGVLSFSSTTTFASCYPYIVYVETAVSNPEGVKLFNINVTDDTANYDQHGGVTFQGSFAPVADASTINSGSWYGVTTGGEIRPAGASATMDGFRAFFTGDVANARIFIMDDEDVTGIAAINREGLAIDNAAVYNLNGQKVLHAKKGVYIVNGRKVVIK